MDKPSTRLDRQQWLVVAILLLLTVAAFWPVLNHDFVLYDDNTNITTNRYVQAGLTWEGLQWALTTTHSGNWNPLTWISHMLDCQLFGLNPMGHHLTGLLFHLANNVLLFLLLAKMSGAVWPSASVAALFAIHPMHVESVAWVSERKDVLSTFLLILTLLAYQRYVQRPGRDRYWIVIVLFALGLTAKPMLVTVPFVLLLLDYWPLGRLRVQRAKGESEQRLVWKLIREKSALFALSVVFSLVTLFAQHVEGAMQTLEDLSLGGRVSNVVVSYAKYMEKMLWPRNLAAFYPHPGSNLTSWQVALSLLFLAAVTALVFRAADRYRYLAVGWLWYLGTLVPVIGIVQVGGQAMADRYSYVPFIGLFVIIAWGVPDLVAGWRYQKAVLAVAAGLVIPLLAVLTWFQVGYWRNTVTLFEHAIRAVPRNYLAHNNLGFLLAEQGKLDEAIAQYQEALKIRPRYVHAHNNLGAALAKKGMVEEAMAHYSIALQVRPGQAPAHVNVGIELAAQGKTDEALLQFLQALRSEPENAKAHYNLGLLLAGQGRLDQATAHYLQALRSKPDYAEAHVNLGVALAQQGKLEDAISHYAEALRIKPDYPEAHINMGIELAGQGKLGDAVKHFAEAVRINPNSAEGHFNLGKAYLYFGDRSSALNEHKILATLNPDLANELKKLIGP